MPARKPVVKSPTIPVSTFPSPALARTWVPLGPFDRRVLDEVVVPTLSRYSRFLLGTGPLPTRERDGVLCRDLVALRHWLDDLLTVPVRPTQIMTPAMLAYALAYHLSSEETEALAQYLTTGQQQGQFTQSSLLGA